MGRFIFESCRLTLADAIRSIFSVIINFSPFNEVGAHVLGFGFRILYHRGEQASITVYVPFYRVYLCRLTTRFPGDGSVPTPELTRTPQEVADDINEHNGRADLWAVREGIAKSDNTKAEVYD